MAIYSYIRQTPLNNILQDFNINISNNKNLLEKYSHLHSTNYNYYDYYDNNDMNIENFTALDDGVFETLKKNLKYYYTDSNNHQIYNFNSIITYNNILKYNKNGKKYISNYLLNDNSLIINYENNSYLLYYNYDNQLNLLSYNYSLNNGLNYDSNKHLIYLNIDNNTIKTVSNILYFDINSIDLPSNTNKGISKIDSNIFNTNNDNLILNQDYKHLLFSYNKIIEHLYDHCETIYNKLAYYESYLNNNYSNIIESYIQINNSVYNYIENKVNDIYDIYYVSYLTYVIYNESKNLVLQDSTTNITCPIPNEVNTLYVKNINNISLNLINNYSSKNYRFAYQPKQFVKISKNIDKNFNISLSYKNSNQKTTYSFNNINIMNNELFKEYGLGIDYSDESYRYIHNNEDYLINCKKIEKNVDSYDNKKYAYFRNKVIQNNNIDNYDNYDNYDNNDYYDNNLINNSYNLYNLTYNKAYYISNQKHIDILYDNRNINKVISVNKGCFNEKINKNSYYILSSKKINQTDIELYIQNIENEKIDTNLDTIKANVLIKPTYLYDYNKQIQYPLSYFNPYELSQQSSTLYTSENLDISNINSNFHYTHEYDYYINNYNKLVYIGYETNYYINPQIINLFNDYNMIYNSSYLYYYEIKNNINVEYDGLFNIMPTKYLNDKFFNAYYYNKCLSREEFETCIDDIKDFKGDILYLYELNNYSSISYLCINGQNTFPQENINFYTWSYLKINAYNNTNNYYDILNATINYINKNTFTPESDETKQIVVSVNNNKCSSKNPFLTKVQITYIENYGYNNNVDYNGCYVGNVGTYNNDYTYDPFTRFWDLLYLTTANKNNTQELPHYINNTYLVTKDFNKESFYDYVSNYGNNFLKFK